MLQTRLPSSTALDTAESDVATLHDLVMAIKAVILQYRRLALVSFSSCLFLSVAVYLFTPARYESETLLLVGQGVDPRPTDFSTNSTKSRTLNSLATIV